MDERAPAGAPHESAPPPLAGDGDGWPYDPQALEFVSPLAGLRAADRRTSAGDVWPADGRPARDA